jgi:diguanylate cyclase (GGDEF)-like protein/PAS domain S-box-containing protein
MTTSRHSITRQAFLRLAVSLGLFVVLLGYASYRIYTVALQKTSLERASNLASFYHTRLSQLDRDWELEALDLVTRIEDTHLALDNINNVPNLQAFLTLHSANVRMEYLLIQNRQGKKFFEFGANLNLDAIPLATGADNGWFHTPDGAHLYRVFIVPIWLGKEGMGRMAGFHEVDNALLFSLAPPGIVLTARHDGIAFSSSAGQLRLARENHTGSNTTDTEQQNVPWSGDETDETYLIIDAPLTTLFSKTELVVASILIPSLIGLILLYSLGFWLIRNARRIGNLGGAVEEFTAQHKSTHTLRKQLDAAQGVQQDEISNVAVALKDMIGLTLQRDQERMDEESRRRLWSMVFASTNEAILITDRNNNILTVNAGFTRMTGYTEEEVVGKNPRLLSANTQPREFYAAMWLQISETGSWAGEVTDKRKNGSTYPKWLNISVVRDTEGKVSNYVGIFQDISERKATEERLTFLSNHDTLTGLPNRQLLLDRLQGAITLARRNHESVTLMFLDLDNFKWVNDSLGHASGDQLLIAVATRLKETVRASDTVARLGGDEFVVLLTHPESDLEIAHIAAKIIQAVARPLDLSGHEFHVTTSMGIGIYPNDGDDAATLLKHADTAMYVAKSAGKNQFRYFDAEMNRHALERTELEQDLRQALKHNEFELFYQPKLHVTSNAVFSAEALIRWRHPRLGLVPPDKFIPLAEETSLIIEIGEWVIREACKQLITWQSQGLGMQSVAVNLSAIQLESDSFVDLVESILRETGIPTKAIEFELTESMVLRNPERSMVTLKRLHELGIDLALDDFGTGYSSLSYLKRLPVDTIKIDRSFVEGVPEQADDSQIVRMICALAKSVRLRIVAEGIETPAQRDFLIEQGCDYLQGYLISKPLPAEEFRAFLIKSSGIN